jgi:hypothetical protein
MIAGAKAIGLQRFPGLVKIFGKQHCVNQVSCSELKVAQIFASGSNEKENSVQIKMQCPVCCK